MVKIIGYSLRENKKGETFVTLQLQGNLVMVQNQETGRFYATAKSCSITSTFSEEMAMALVGTEIPGKIEKVPCEEYEYIIEETGEVISLSHRWEYLPDEAKMPLRSVSLNEAA